MHDFCDAHHTPARVDKPGLSGAGAGTIDQCPPCHISISVNSWVLFSVSPTAVQVLADVHDTELNSLA